MRSSVLIAAAAGLLFPLAPGEAREPLRLQPSSKWVLNYAEDSCRLARSFGEGDGRVTLILEQFEPSETFRMSLAGKPVRASATALPVKAALRFGPNEGESQVTAMAGTLGADPVLIINEEQRLAPPTKSEEAAEEQAQKRGDQFQPAPLGQAREAAATRLEVIRGLRNPLILETGPMDKPLGAVRQCAWETVAHWGLDVGQQKSLTRRLSAKPRTRPWVQAADYPASMIRGGYQGIVHFRLMVDATGTPTSCHIQLSTRPKEFDDAVCRGVMKRARFEPALDAQGKPVPSYWIQTVQFRIQ